VGDAVPAKDSSDHNEKKGQPYPVNDPGFAGPNNPGAEPDYIPSPSPAGDPEFWKHVIVHAEGEIILPHWKLWADGLQLGLDAQRVIAMRLARI
jgi:hypothetical protein